LACNFFAASRREFVLIMRVSTAHLTIASHKGDGVDITVQSVLISGSVNDSCQMYSATWRDLTAAAAAVTATSRRRTQRTVMLSQQAAGGLERHAKTSEVGTRFVSHIDQLAVSSVK